MSRSALSAKHVPKREREDSRLSDMPTGAVIVRRIEAMRVVAKESKTQAGDWPERQLR
jgi:hypothetical protein